MIGPPLLGRTVSPGAKFLCIITSPSGLIAMSQGYSDVQKGRGFRVPCPVPSSHRCAPLLVEEQKNTGVGKYPEVFGHAGLLVNWSPGNGRVTLQLVIRRLQVLCGAGLKFASPPLLFILSPGTRKVNGSLQRAR